MALFGGERKVLFCSLREKSSVDMMNGGDHSELMDNEPRYGGDVYGEDSATEDQLVTPWTVSVARLEINSELLTLSLRF